MNGKIQKLKNMFVPIENEFYTSPIANYVTIASIEQEKIFVPLNLTNEELCLQLKRNLTDDLSCPPCCETAPQLTDKIIIKVIVLSLMGIFSLIGNVATIWNIRKNRASRRALRHSCSAIYALLLHLSVADILVTFFCIIGEAIWSYTVQWLAGDIACKLVKIFQMFALYLSTNVLVLIGIDRWVAVKYPMKSKFLNTARFVVFIYVISFILSLPQGFIFRVQRGPFIEDFHQCVTFGFYTAKWQEQLYTTFTLILMFIIPLVILTSSYISTFRTISSSERMFKLEAGHTTTSTHFDHMRRSDSNRQKLIHKAKMRSLRISVVIVVGFIVCWFPYYAMMLIFMFTDVNKSVSEDLQSGIFFFGMSNSLINPIIYGAFQYQPVKKRRHYLKRRDGSIIHRSLSTNATTVKNLNNFNNVAMPNNNNRCSIHESHSSHHEYPKVKNMENMELMSLEKELQTLQEKSNFGKYHEQRFSEQLLRFFKRNHSQNTRNGRK